MDGNIHPYHIHYIGPSMYPTLKPGDILYVFPYRGQCMRPGDIAVAQLSVRRQPIVHRIISIDQKKIIMRGDNNIDTDPFIILPADIIGRVEKVQRNNKCFSVSRGKKGWLTHRFRRFFKRFDLMTSRVLGPLYRYLSRNEKLIRIGRNCLKTKLVSFKCDNGSELMLMIGRHVIGRFSHASGKWVIRRPFRLFIDERTLPKT